ncbi:molybdate ABC transporter substrate-binding protein [Nocardioides sp. HDW12B]|uniref:molybdate ABC transporter substrate-binding protein n=1 Tax=Nocardioides sp. HDW12B TaxID=2714939 RepID=UPI00140B3742|nr:molybdate ABC transporter substrate-binding protein [Nocardioides sp. HDW12B]QIK67490.1 molybdate ABC transporter substrate-binding protein [Nocardioides sp. HDW12B]
MRAVAVVLVALATLTACGGSGRSGGSGAEDVTLDVLAASSLTESFEALAEDFEADNPGVTVRLSLGSSSALAQQVTEGAPADVLATADLPSMELAGDDVAAATEFATNELVLVTPSDDPGGISSLDDLADAQFVTCVDSAPCGALADQLLEDAGVTAEPVSREADVKAVLAKVTSGEVDAGFVYVTDAVAAGDEVRRVEVPGAADLPARYAVATVTEAREPELAEAWVDLVLGEDGQQALADAGFGPPVDGSP